MSLKKVTIKSHEISWPRPPIIIGTGRLGKVYKVQYQGRDVAIKSSSNDMTAILEDFHIYHKLRRNEFVLKFHGFMLRGDKIALVTEYAANGTLGQFLKKNTSIGWELRAKLCHDIALGLFQCHEERITHFNLKPENIFLTTDLTPKIAGFTNNKSKIDEDLTVFQPSGTIHWAAPEVIANDASMKQYYQDNPELADIYSFGLIMWSTACNGAIPYEGVLRDNILAEKRQINSNELLRNQLSADCPFEFAQMFLKLTRYNPRQRAHLLYVLVVLEGLFDVRTDLQDHTMSFSKLSHSNSIMRYTSQDDLGESAVGQESDTNSQHALINHSTVLNSSQAASIKGRQTGVGSSYPQRPISPINTNPKTDAEMLDEVIIMYVEAEKFGFDWLAKNLKKWAENDENDPKKIFTLLQNGGERRYRDSANNGSTAAIETLAARKKKKKNW
ncbi:11010_t:CDS:2 [Ambispora gerdemannii]|uniref:11010_t:CDS:1 n=1 Tax=Ambispora gerdemannii TaxID=144530 RepID=A0A9N8ZR38_9GLOM|nr:11010_t:CDS:2 [Ambispora gerdemannii]